MAGVDRTADLMSPCAACGMLVHPGEYHPYAACLMFKTCENSTEVRVNLEAVLDHGREEMESVHE